VGGNPGDPPAHEPTQKPGLIQPDVPGGLPQAIGIDVA
jgi:hypothetical protein